MDKLSDEMLVAHFQGGRQDAFDVLMSRYKQKIYAYLLRSVKNYEDAEELTIEVFIKIYRALGTWEPRAKFTTWIYRIATNEALNYLRKKKRRFFIPIGDIEHELSSSLDTDIYYSGDEIQLKLQKALLKLPEKQRLVFNMKYFEEMKFKDIAEIMEVSIGGLKAQFHHAVKKIEKFIQED